MGAKQFRTRVRKKVFEVGPKKEECEKGGGCEAVSHLGAKKRFSGASVLDAKEAVIYAIGNSKVLKKST